MALGADEDAERLPLGQPRVIRGHFLAAANCSTRQPPCSRAAACWSRPRLAGIGGAGRGPGRGGLPRALCHARAASGLRRCRRSLAGQQRGGHFQHVVSESPLAGERLLGEVEAAGHDVMGLGQPVGER